MPSIIYCSPDNTERAASERQDLVFVSRQVSENTESEETRCKPRKCLWEKNGVRNLEQQGTFSLLFALQGRVMTL